MYSVVNYSWITFIQMDSVAYKITGRRRNRKSLEVPCKDNYYYGSTKHTAFIFVITLFPQSPMRLGVYTRPTVV